MEIFVDFSPLVMVSIISDWALLAPVFTLLFAWAKGNAKKMKIAFTAATCLFGTFNFLEELEDSLLI